MTNLTDHLIGKHVLVRSNMSGVHLGTLVHVEGTGVRLANSRRLWEWSVANKGGVSLSEVAIMGIDQVQSKITETLPDIVIYDVCELIEAYGMAIASITGANTYTP